MKLRAYTAEETDELINKFKVIAEYAYSINNAAYNLLTQKYDNYCKNFRPSLFNWFPKDFKYFVSKLNNYDKARFCNWSFDPDDYDVFYRNELFSEPGKFLRSVNFHDCYDHYMYKRSGQRFTKEERDLLIHASSIADNTLFGYTIHEKYRNLMKYAHRPFEFDEDDIGWLENVEFKYKKAIEWNSNLLNDNRSIS